MTANWRGATGTSRSHTGCSVRALAKQIRRQPRNFWGAASGGGGTIRGPVTVRLCRCGCQCAGAGAVPLSASDGTRKCSLDNQRTGRSDLADSDSESERRLPLGGGGLRLGVTGSCPASVATGTVPLAVLRVCNRPPAACVPVPTRTRSSGGHPGPDISLDDFTSDCYCGTRRHGGWSKLKSCQ
jgi:hypothetical protein